MSHSFIKNLVRLVTRFYCFSKRLVRVFNGAQVALVENIVGLFVRHRVELRIVRIRGGMGFLVVELRLQLFVEILL